jgi:hypothetical protein
VYTSRWTEALGVILDHLLTRTSPPHSRGAAQSTFHPLVVGPEALRIRTRAVTVENRDLESLNPL